MGIEIIKINSDRDWKALLEKGYILTLRNDERHVPMAHVKHNGKKTGVVVSVDSIEEIINKKDTERHVPNSSFNDNDSWWRETWKFNGHSSKKLLTRIVRVN